MCVLYSLYIVFKDPATTEIYPLTLLYALPICEIVNWQMVLFFLINSKCVLLDRVLLLVADTSLWSFCCNIFETPD